MSDWADGHEFAVTGAASGIGAAVTTALAERGARVWCLDLAGPRLDQFVAGVAGRGHAEGLAANVADPDEVAAAFAAIGESTGGTLHGLVNCAADRTPGRVKPFEDFSVDDWLLPLRVNLIGTYLTMKHAAALLRATGDGRIVNIASAAGKVPGPMTAPYNASKAGVISLTRSAAKALAPEVNVNCICPGHVDTPGLASLREDARLAGLAVDFSRANQARLGRPATPAEMADVILYLLSPAASFITGEDINTSGGLVMF